MATVSSECEALEGAQAWLLQGLTASTLCSGALVAVSGQNGDTLPRGPKCMQPPTCTTVSQLAMPDNLPACPAPADLAAPASKWTVGGTPLLSMMHLERRAGR